ncbi:GIY-YIG nuclease family protein [Vibrio sp. RC27]
MPNQSIWSVYFIRTPDQRLYCGISVDVARRLRQHQNGTGAKALRGKTPLELVWTMEIGDHSVALQVEYRLKKLPKIKKEAIVRDEYSKKRLFEYINISN